MVQEKLFPYALEHVESFLNDNWDEESTKVVIAALRKQAKDDIDSNVEGVVSIPDEVLQNT